MTALDDATAPADTQVRPFPAGAYAHAGSYCDDYLSELARAASAIDELKIDRAAATLLHAYRRGATVFACGNGGSAAIANHLQCDHLKGVRTGTDIHPRVVSLSSSIELITAIANDIAYEDIFQYQLESQSRPGDVLVTISSSGRSPNIVKAIRWARDHDLRTIAFTGFEGGDAKRLAEVAVHVDCCNYGIVEDLHQATMHSIAQYIRQSRMDPDDIPSVRF